MADPNADVEVRTDPEVPALAVRLQVPMAGLDVGALFGEQMGRLGAHLDAHGGVAAGPPYARYHEWGAERADIELGLPVEQPPAGLAALDSVAPGDIGASALPRGRRAVVLHAGPYPELGHAYAVLERWLADTGETGSGAPWESYVVLPGDVDGDDAALRTEVCWPLA